ncbi:MAG TPA: ATP-binding protein [Cytophagaceae bacterium]|jgi:signal transduction histidine kinase|nr:ATP-binding protein [Cytophagaceae bacterium]
MRLKTEISLILIVKSLVFVIVCTAIFYYSAQTALVTQINNQLESLSQTKENRLKSTIEKRLEELYLVNNNSIIRNNLIDYNSKHKQTYIFEINKAISLLRKNISSCRHIHILDLDGKVLASTRKNGQLQNFSTKQCFYHARKGEPCLHEFFKDEENRLNHYIASRIYSGLQPIGIVIIESAADEILSICNDYTGLGKTGETTLSKRDSTGSALSVTPLRFMPEASLTRSVPKDDQNFEMNLALAGKEKFFEDVLDYRSEHVMASTRYIEGTGWGMVTKIDRREGLASLDYLRNITLVITIGTVFLLIVSSFMFADYVVKPIKLITNTASRISEGDLSQRVNFESANELGILASSFNKMTESLIEAKKKVEHKVEELDKSNEALNKFAYIVSHDLKAPLNSVKGITELLKMELKEKLDDDGRKMLDMLTVKVNGMQDLITTLLHYSQIGSEPNKELVDLQEVVTIAIENISPPAYIQISIENDLPSLQWDRTSALQVFQNLIGNAVKYMDKSGGSVRIGVEREEGLYRFCVTDDGPGIDPKHHQKIFEIFQTIHAKNNDSSGIGLAIVKKIVENAGGKVWVESEQSKGASFIFTIPLES